MRPEQGLLGIRKALGLYANLRPVARASVAASTRRRCGRSGSEGVDLLVVRELTGGIYFGEKGSTAPDGGERASDLCTYDTEEIERVVRVAAELAREPARQAHVGRQGERARDVAALAASRDASRRGRISRRRSSSMCSSTRARCTCVTSPARFDVIVTENMFGDILTDEAAMLAGSIGLLPSASLGRAARHARGLYEPIHGSAPDIAGHGDRQPVGTILSAAMLLRHSLGLEAEAKAVERAVSEAVKDGARDEGSRWLAEHRRRGGRGVVAPRPRDYRGVAAAGCALWMMQVVIPSERSESRDLHLWFLTESTENTANTEGPAIRALCPLRSRVRLLERVPPGWSALQGV